MRKNDEIFCNKCGKKIGTKEDVTRQEMLHVEKVWGYFSSKDGEKHSFDVCENCYDEWMKEFVIPVEITEEDILI